MANLVDCEVVSYSLDTCVPGVVGIAAVAIIFTVWLVVFTGVGNNVVKSKSIVRRLEVDR